jgi:hypothetical protein
MNRPIAIVGAPSSIGVRPYDTGEARHFDRAPGTLRRLHIVERLGAIDVGDVVPPRIETTFVRPVAPGTSAKLQPTANRLATAPQEPPDRDGSSCGMDRGKLEPAVGLEPTTC